MPPIKKKVSNSTTNKKVWNEDLVVALRARAVVAQQNGNRNAISYNVAANKIEEIRKDIKVGKNFVETGRIQNLPLTTVSKSIHALIHSIIIGTTPILPNGYIPTNPTEHNNNSAATGSRSRIPTSNIVSYPAANNITNNPYENDSYLKTIKRRGGAYAILIAFHLSTSSTMNKTQIIKAAQPYCDEIMDSNFHTGRLFGAWKSIETFEKHTLVIRSGHKVQYNHHAGGFRSTAPASFTITNNGRLFTNAMLQRYPLHNNDNHNHDGNTNGTPMSHKSTTSTASRIMGMNDLHSSISSSTLLPFSSPNRISFGTGTRSTAAASDNKGEQELIDWIQTSHINDTKVFKLSKEKRKKLHNYCDQLNQTILLTTNKQLRHESFGTGQSRKLQITIIKNNSSHVASSSSTCSAGGGGGGYYNNTTEETDYDEYQNDVRSFDFIDPVPETSGNTYINSPGGGGRTLGYGNQQQPLLSITKGSVQVSNSKTLSAKEAAAQAAIRRQEQYEQSKQKRPHSYKIKSDSHTISANDMENNSNNSIQEQEEIAMAIQLVQSSILQEQEQVNKHNTNETVVPIDNTIDCDVTPIVIASSTIIHNNNSNSSNSNNIGTTKRRRSLKQDTSIVDLTDLTTTISIESVQVPVVATTVQVKPIIILDSSVDTIPETIISKRQRTKLHEQHNRKGNNDSNDDEVIVIDTDTAITSTASQHLAQPLSSEIVTIPTSTKLIMYIDNRERNRNPTPRMLRMKLTQLVSTNSATTSSCSLIEQVIQSLAYQQQQQQQQQTTTFDISVEEKRLTIGDFAF
jgi:hypothetical protein